MEVRGLNIGISRHRALNGKRTSHNHRHATQTLYPFERENCIPFQGENATVGDGVRFLNQKRRPPNYEDCPRPVNYLDSQDIELGSLTTLSFVVSAHLLYNSRYPNLIKRYRT